MTKLDVNKLFCAARASIREHFGNDSSSFWLFDELSKRLRCVPMGFPSKSDFLREMAVAEVSQESLEKVGTRRPSICSIPDLSKTYPAFADALIAESIVLIVDVPLVTRTGPSAP